MFGQSNRFNHTEKKTPRACLCWFPVLRLHQSNYWIVGFDAADEIADVAIKISWSKGVAAQGCLQRSEARATRGHVTARCAEQVQTGADEGDGSLD